MCPLAFSFTQAVTNGIDDRARLSQAKVIDTVLRCMRVNTRIGRIEGTCICDVCRWSPWWK